MNILLTCFYFDGFSGSPIHCMEMGEHLAQKHSVSIAAVKTNQEMIDLCRSKSINLYNLEELPLNSVYDIVIAYHFPIAPYLIDKGLKYKKLVNGVLSSFGGLETPLFFSKDIDLFPCMCEETISYISDTFNIDKSKTYLLPNFLPDIYARKHISFSSELKKVLVVSNHTPQELCNLSAQSSLDVDYIGDKGKPLLITPEVLLNYDAVITIGKTVQYCLGLGIPVYEYDVFGGAGYISLQNIDKEEHHNFSGRGTPRKLTTQQIIQELEENYSKCTSELCSLQTIALERYSLKKNVDKLIEKILSLKDTQIKTDAFYKQQIEYVKTFIKQINVLSIKETIKKHKIYNILGIKIKI